MKRIARYTLFFTGMMFLIATGIMQASAAEFWMPRTTLKDDLKVRSAPTSSSSTVFKAKQGESLRQVSVSGKWIQVQRNGFEGYVYKPSVVKFKNDSGYFYNKIFQEITYFIQSRTIFIKVGAMCFVIPLDVVESLEQGYDNKQTIQEYLDGIGGLRAITDDEMNTCFSQ